MVLIVEFAMVVIMQYDEWVIVENVVDTVMFVELQIGGLASSSSSIKKSFCGAHIFLGVSIWISSQEVCVRFPTT